MATAVNAHLMNAAMLARASEGIIAPVEVGLAPKLLLYRFGGSVANARGGGWWLDEQQFTAVKTWAAVHGLALPLAARVHCAVAHSWGATSPSGVNMTVLIRAEVLAPLRAYQGRSAPQSVVNAGRIDERLSPDELLGDPINQLYIPGIDDPAINKAALLIGEPVIYDVGASHIGGVPGIPKGALIQ